MDDEWVEENTERTDYKYQSTETLDHGEKSVRKEDDKK